MGHLPQLPTKQPWCTTPLTSKPKPDRARKWSLWAVGITCVCLFVRNSIQAKYEFYSALEQPPNSEPASRPFSWSEITPTKQISYTECYGYFHCGRLLVPRDWNATVRDHELDFAIAIVKLPAKVPVTDERYGGAIIFNPGGPGESGIHQVLSAGKHLQTIVDSPSQSSQVPSLKNGTSEKYFDIIGFDPRGTNNTTPRLQCFPDAYNQRDWFAKYPDYSLLWDSDSVLGLEWARAEALGLSCSRPSNEDSLVRYVNTAQTVTDMLEITERHAEWREATAQKLIARGDHGTEEVQTVLTRTKWRKGRERIQFWGFSYGTLIGQTFAAMYPDRVHRLIIDGNIDPVDYYAGAWLTQLQDSDKIITSFCEYCHEAGPERCPLYTGDSAKQIEERIDRLMASLKVSPIALAVFGTMGPEVITYGDVMLNMLNGMYFSYKAAESLFAMLAELDVGNVTRVVRQKQAWNQLPYFSPACQREGPFSDACMVGSYHSLLGANQAIGCMDIGGRTNLTKQDFKVYLTELRSQSRFLSGSWARNKLACVGFNTTPAWTFEGPISGITSHPLLIIGNTHDTVTPLGNARRASTYFPNSVVLQQDSQGHCSYSNPSICTGQTIRTYFQQGTLPENGTVCQPEFKPFIGCLHKDENGACRNLSDEDKELWNAMEAITEVWP